MVLPFDNLDIYIRNQTFSILILFCKILFKEVI